MSEVIIGVAKADYSLELIFVYFEGLKVIFDSFFYLVKFIANVGKSYQSKRKPVVHLESPLNKLSSSFQILHVVINYS